MKFISTLFALVLAISSMTVSATVTPSVGNVVLVGCNLSSPNGAQVYSIDNSIVNGSGVDSVTLPTSVQIGSSCSLVLNALNGVACTGSHVWTASAPVNMISSVSGYSLQQFFFTCQ